MKMITKNQYKKALEQNRIIVTGTRYTNRGWTGFRVFEIRNNKVIEINVECGYKSKKIWGYKCSAIGTNRILEIIISIGYNLGLKFDEIKQNFQWLSEK